MVVFGRGGSSSIFQVCKVVASLAVGINLYKSNLVLFFEGGGNDIAKLKSKKCVSRLESMMCFECNVMCAQLLSCAGDTAKKDLAT